MTEPMDDLSVFPDKETEPTDRDLANKLGPAYDLWQRIHEMTLGKYPNGRAEWNYPGKKYGWSFRIKDKKRAIIYLLPRNRSFMVGFVFGDKAFKSILERPVSGYIKEELARAKKYAEGRGIRINVTDQSILSDIEQLIEIKLQH